MPVHKSSARHLYRIVPFHRFAQMLRNGQWYFAHPSEWEDPYETRMSNDLSSIMFAQCWCRKAVSDAMWRIYSKDRLGVRLRVNEEALRLALNAAQKTEKIHITLKKVKYINEIQYVTESAKIKRDLSLRVTEARAAKHLFLKRTAFDHEAESRIVLFDYREPPGTTSKGRCIELNTAKLVTSVLIDPRAPDELAEALTLMLKRTLLFPGRVSKSVLYRQNKREEE